VLDYSRTFEPCQLIVRHFIVNWV